MKIALLIWDLNITGGTQRQALELACSLKEQGHEVDVYSYLYDKENCYRELCEKLPIFSVKTANDKKKKEGGKKEPRKESALYRFLKKQYGTFNMYRYAIRELRKPNDNIFEMKTLIEKRHPLEYYDVINLHDYEVYKISRVLNHPRIVWMMNDIKRYPITAGNIFHRSLFNLLQKFLAKKETEHISEITVLDHRNKKMAEETYHKKAIVVRSGIDLDMFTSIQRKPHPGTYTIFASSIFFPWRRFEDLVDAVEILAEKNIRNISVTINGIPDRSVNYYAFIKERIAEKRLEKYITIVTGMSEDRLKKQYMNTDFFVFPNHNQTWGLVVFEAMLAGCAAIVSKTSGAHEMLTDKENALLVNPESPQEIADAIEFLIKHPAEKERIARNGKTYVEKTLSWKKYSEQMMRVFEQTNN